jgi:hypothetical protein
MFVLRISETVDTTSVAQYPLCGRGDVGIKKSPFVKSADRLNGGHAHLQSISVQELQHGRSRTQGSQLFAPVHQTL